MRIEAITNPLHVVHTPTVKSGDERHYLVLGKTSTKSLIKNYICHVLPDDSRSPVICSRECEHFRYCEFGQEYIKRMEAGA